MTRSEETAAVHIQPDPEAVIRMTGVAAPAAADRHRAAWVLDPGSNSWLD